MRANSGSVGWVILTECDYGGYCNKLNVKLINYRFYSAIGFTIRVKVLIEDP